MRSGWNGPSRAPTPVCRSHSSRKGGPLTGVSKNEPSEASRTPAVAADEIVAAGIARTSRGSADHYASAILQIPILRFWANSEALRPIGFKEQALPFARTQPGIGFFKPFGASTRNCVFVITKDS